MSLKLLVWPKSAASAKYILLGGAQGVGMGLPARCISWRLEFLVAALWLHLVAAPALAQGVSERRFEVLNTPSTVEQSCAFLVQPEELGIESRAGFQLQLPSYSLSVSMLSGLGLNVTNAAADRTFDQAANLLKAHQGGVDVNCCIDIQRLGSISTFSPPAAIVGGIITSQAEQDAVFALAGDIKIVLGIQFCGITGGFAGCADGSSMIVVNTFAPPGTNVFTDPATVAHEIGHWAGLGHVAQSCTPTSSQCGTGLNACTDCSDGFANHVMYCRTCAGAPDQGVITLSQCNAYQGNVP